MKTASNLERLLDKGQFTVTAQPLLDGIQDEKMIRESGRNLSKSVDAIMLPDNQKGRVALSSLAGAVLLSQLGHEAIMHMACRDRNRIALESDLIGAYALGIRNVVCLSGDHSLLGNRPEAKAVYDLDSLQLIALVKRLQDSWPMYVGAVENPFADPEAFRVARLEKKFMAGADFVLTQVIFDLDRFLQFMERVRARGLQSKGKIIASLMVLNSGYRIRELARTPGIWIPPSVVESIEQGRKEKSRALCREYLRILRGTEGVSGVHILFEEWEDVVYIMENEGLVPNL